MSFYETISDIFLIAGTIGLFIFANPYGIIILAFDDTKHRKSNIRIAVIGSIVSLLLFVLHFLT